MKTNRKILRKIKEINKIYSLLEYEQISNENIGKRFKKSENKNEKLALIKLIIKRMLGLTAYDAQIMCAIHLIDGYAVEMRTGEGKSISALMAGLYLGQTEKVYIVTVNEYLANRDYVKFKAIYDTLNINVGLNTESIGGKDSAEIYENSVIYTSSSALIFDYLSSKLSGEIFEMNFAILDEIDFILLDNANTYFTISSEQDEIETYNLSIIHKVDKVFRELIGGEIKYRVDTLDYDYIDKLEYDYIYSRPTRNSILTKQGEQKILDSLGIESLDEDIIIYASVANALEAYSFHRKDVEYLIEDNKIKLITQSTGRQSENTQLGEGLHSALEAKEGVEVTPRGGNTITSSYQVMFSKFNKLSGMSGTIMSDSKEFLELYGMLTVKIPLHNKDRSSRLGNICFKTTQEKYKFILEMVKERHKIGQPVLVICSNEKESNIVYTKLEDNGVRCRLLNNRYTEIEDDIVETAGHAGKVTISTSMAGRGTDICITEESNNVGGLLVISMTNYESVRIENQIKGRAGRQGFRGEFKQLSSLEDDIWSNLEMTKYMKIKRINDNEFYSEKYQKKLHKKLRRIQKSLGAKHYSVRQYIFATQKIKESIRDYVYNYLNNMDNIEEFINSTLEKEINDVKFIMMLEKIYGITLIKEFHTHKNSVKVHYLTQIVKNRLKYTHDEYLDLARTLYSNSISKGWTDLEIQLTGICNSVSSPSNFKERGITEFIRQSLEPTDKFIRSISIEVLSKLIVAKKGEN